MFWSPGVINITIISSKMINECVKPTKVLNNVLITCDRWPLQMIPKNMPCFVFFIMSERRLLILIGQVIYR